MASAPLKWLLTIGDTALKTTAKVLTDAVNELHDAVGTLNTRASSLESTKADTTTVNNGLNTKVNKTDALTLEEIEASTNLTNKVAAASAVDGINKSLTASDGLNFNFSTDGEGNYGYLKGDDTFVPFKSGSEIHKLGTGWSFSIVDIVGAENVGKYSASNFITGASAFSQYRSTDIDNVAAASYWASADFTGYTISYDNTTGVVSASGGTLTYKGGINTFKPKGITGTASIAPIIYFIK